MALPFPVADEPDEIAAERGRKMFAGPVEFLKGVVAMSGLPASDRIEVCFAGRSNVGDCQFGSDSCSGLSLRLQ